MPTAFIANDTTSKVSTVDLVPGTRKWKYLETKSSEEEAIARTLSEL